MHYKCINFFLVKTVNLHIIDMKQNNIRNSISLHVFVKKNFWFRSIPQNTNTHTGIGILQNGTEPEKFVHIVIWTLWYDMEIQC